MKVFNLKELKERRGKLRREMTPEERLLWQHLHRSRLCGIKFRRQTSIDYYIVDFYAPSLKLAIELDGAQHETEYAKEYDAVRTEFMQGAGITVLRFKNHTVKHDITNVLKMIQNTICALHARLETT